MKKTLLLCAGVLALILGTLGIFLPVLPTTPFVLLAGICFSGSSPKAYAFLQNSRYFGPYLENYRTKRGVPLRTKVKSLVMLWALLILSAVITDKLWLRLLLIAIGTGVSAHLLSIKTLYPHNHPRAQKAKLPGQPPHGDI